MNLDDYSIIMVGRIVEYFPTTQTATVKICNDQTFDSVEDTDQQVGRGLLNDVPVHTPSGGGWSMTFPIAFGEPCQLSFSQFGYDHWFVDNEDSAGIRIDGHPQPWTYRRFDLADGFAQVGYNNLVTAIADYSDTDAEFRSADRSTRIALTESGNIDIVAGTTTIVINKDGQVNITTPVVTMSGDLVVEGTSTLKGAVTSEASVTAPVISGTTSVSATTNLTVAGKEMSGHIHSNGHNGGNTGGPV